MLTMRQRIGLDWCHINPHIIITVAHSSTCDGRFMICPSLLTNYNVNEFYNTTFTWISGGSSSPLNSLKKQEDIIAWFSAAIKMTERWNSKYIYNLSCCEEGATTSLYLLK